MRFLFLILSIFCNYNLHAAELRELGEVSPYSRLPVMLRGDARAFHSAIDPLLSKDVAGYERRTLKNPYELFMEVTLLGRAFGLMPSAASDQGLGDSITSLVTAREAQSARKHLLEINKLKSGGADVAEIDKMQVLGYLNEFDRKFNGKLTELMGAKNVYAYFVKGLMLYEQGVLENQQSLKTQAELYLACAADAYCEPALRFLEWLYTSNKQSKLGSIVGNKLEHATQTGMLSSNIKEVIKYAIEKAIFGESIAAKVLAHHTKRNQVVDSTFTVDPLTKLVETAFGDAGFDQAFYKGVLGHLSSTSYRICRETPGMTHKLASASAFLFVASFSSYINCRTATAYAALYPNASSGQIWLATLTGANLRPNAGNIDLVYTVNSVVLTVFSVIPFVISMYYVKWSFNTPRLATNQATLSRECKLSALYLAAVRQPTDVDEVVAEKVIKFWCADKRCLFGKKPSLSQLVVKHKGG